MGGELRQVTVLMSDLRGFTSLSERLAAGQVVAVINRYLSLMTDIIMEHNGTIEEFMGDGIKATFGTIDDGDRHAEHAVACALAMQMAMDNVNTENVGDGLPEVEMGIGLHTGSAVLGNIGSQKRAKYGVFGRHVNHAARIESYTVGGQILMSEYTRNEVTAELSVRGSMEIVPKGVQQPLTVFDVAGIGPPYNLQLPAITEELPRVLRQPVPLQFRILAEKDAGGQELPGELIALGTRQASLRTQAPVTRHDDVLLLIPDGDHQPQEIYAKAVEIDDEDILVRFTSLPHVVKTALHAVLDDSS
jgi:adenylate cyclase